MRSLIAAVILLALGWSAYWFVGAAREEAAVADWIGAHGQAADISTRGFPSRFDTTILALKLPAGDFGWSASRVQVNRFSYAEDHYVLVFGPEQRLTLPGMALPVTAADARASAVFEDGALDRAVFILEAPRVVSEAGWVLTAARLGFGPRRQGDAYEFGLDAFGLSLDGESTDLHVEGKIALTAGVPEGNLTLTATDPEAFARIAAAVGLPDAVMPVTVGFSGGAMTWNGMSLGPAPRLR